MWSTDESSQVVGLKTIASSVCAGVVVIQCNTVCAREYIRIQRVLQYVLCTLDTEENTFEYVCYIITVC